MKRLLTKVQIKYLEEKLFDLIVNEFVKGIHRSFIYSAFPLFCQINFLIFQF